MLSWQIMSSAINKRGNIGKERQGKGIGGGCFVEVSRDTPF